MGRDLVFEVCVMVPQGLPTLLSRPLGGTCGRVAGGSICDIPRKWSRLKIGSPGTSFWPIITSA